MIPSSMPGKIPLSNRLQEWLSDTQEDLLVIEDEFDQLINEEGLSISRFVYFRDLDLMLIVLSNMRVISQLLSTYSFLSNASDEQLNEYQISATGIHWSTLDVDLSLRGFLMTELRYHFRNPRGSSQAA